MLTPHQIELVKATVPVLQAHGVDLTKHFYARMLSKNPELRNVFNQAHQARGAQQQALAAAVLAYAQNIEHPENLLGAVKQIAQRHCSLGIRAEQYQIVGHHLIESIKEVLGAAATPELIDAWTAAYGMLADILIKAEQDIYNQQTAAQGGWSGWRPFECVNRVQESEDVVSFYFRPTDGGPVPSYLPGQYTTVRVFSKAMQIAQPRQYTLSQAAGSGMLRISVKLVLGTQGAPDGLVSSILHNRVKVGDVVVSSKSADIKPGNCLPFENIPVGTIIHNIELYPGRGAQLVRSAGNMAQLMAKENGYALVRLPSGEMRNVPVNCTAVIGQVSNIDHENVNLGKAGRKRHMGVRPGSRGTVMNPCDHPHGGGEGRAPVGHSGPMTPWGKPALGLKTRKHHKRSDKLIVKRAGK